MELCRVFQYTVLSVFVFLCDAVVGVWCNTNQQAPFLCDSIGKLKKKEKKMKNTQSPHFQMSLFIIFLYGWSIASNFIAFVLMGHYDACIGVVVFLYSLINLWIAIYFHHLEKRIFDLENRY